MGISAGSFGEVAARELKSIKHKAGPIRREVWIVRIKLDDRYAGI
jgi:hypothetical protein